MKDFAKISENSGINIELETVSALEVHLLTFFYRVSSSKAYYLDFKSPLRSCSLF